MPEKREDVEATLQQDTAPDTSQQKRKWRAIDRIACTTLAAEVLMSFIWAILWVHECRFEHQLQMYFALVLIILTLGYLALIFCPIFKKDNDPRWFHARILSSGIVGGSYAFLLPVVMSLPEGSVTSGGAAALRQAILLATGGLIGLVALGETRRKNDNDLKAANELQIRHKETLDQQKSQFKKQIKKQQQQFEANAFKERKAERRERYTKAVEQLGDEKAPIRMGGVYTLVGLVDEWLEDKNLSDDQRLKEGQVIINNLCAYIRSPFTFKSRMENLQPEADVRLGIIKEIHGRLQGSEENTPGTWSEFEYNFSGSRFFYSVDLTNSYYTKSVNFSGSTYKGEANFSGSTYKGEANFSGSTYKGEADFSGSTYENKEKNVLFSTSDSPSIYEGKADFSHSTYQGDADFSHSTYQGEANFYKSTYENKEKNVLFSTSDSPSIYQGEANFYGSTYEGWADFSGSTYEKDVCFSSYVPHSTYDRANFSGSTYKGKAEFSDSTYQWADFSGSTYEGEANFYSSIYKGRARFRESTYEQDVLFSTSALCSTYEGNADFSGSTYKGEADFSGSTYENKEKKVLFSTSDSPSIYEGKADFSDSTYQDDADFSHSIYKGEADFSGSPYLRNPTYKNRAAFSGSIFYQEAYFGKDGNSNRSSRFLDRASQFYDERNRKNTLFGSPDNDFTVDTSEGYPIDLNSEGLPLGCNFLTTEQKEYLADIFQEIEKINNKLLEAKDDKEKARLSDTLRSLYKELHEWREEATTVKVEDVIAEDTES